MVDNVEMPGTRPHVTCRHCWYPNLCSYMLPMCRNKTGYLKKNGNWFEYPSPCIFICGACYVAKLQWVYCDIYIRSSIRTWPWRGRIQLVNQGTGLRSVEQSLAMHVSWNLFMANETCSYVQMCRIQKRKAHILVQYLRHAEQDACSLHVSFSSSVSL